MKSPQTTETSAYLQGRAAFQQGVAYDACPCAAPDPRSQDWKWGHYDAEEASKAKEAAR